MPSCSPPQSADLLVEMDRRPHCTMGSNVRMHDPIVKPCGYTAATDDYAPPALLYGIRRASCWACAFDKLLLATPPHPLPGNHTVRYQLNTHSHRLQESRASRHKYSPVVSEQVAGHTLDTEGPAMMTPEHPARTAVDGLHVAFVAAAVAAARTPAARAVLAVRIAARSDREIEGTRAGV